MSDKTIRLIVDYTYDADAMHGNDTDSIGWFNGVLMGDYLQLVEEADIADTIGKIKVVAAYDWFVETNEELKVKLTKAREEGFWAGRSCGGAKKEIDAALAELKGQDDG